MTQTPFYLLENDDNDASIAVAEGIVQPAATLAAGHARETAAGHARETVRLDCGGALLGPADVNAHTHLYSGLVPFGMPQPQSAPENFLQILEQVWWRLDRALDAHTLRAAARWYVADALLAGCGALIDHHESPRLIHGSLDILAEACQELGMRAVLCYGATERNGGREEAQAGLAECERFSRSNARSLIRGAVGLHAGFTVSDETILEAGVLCRTLGAPLHIHLAEDLADLRDARDRGHEGPLQRLRALDALQPGAILAHGVHLNQAEVELSASLGAYLVQNPRSNTGNDVGYPRFIHCSKRVALGTDGYPAHMNEELMALVGDALRHREQLCDVTRRAERGRTLLSQLFGAELGAAPGQRADVAAFYHEARFPRVKHLIVDGRLVVRDGQLVAGDFEQIRAEATAAAAQLWERMRNL